MQKKTAELFAQLPFFASALSSATGASIIRCLSARKTTDKNVQRKRNRKGFHNNRRASNDTESTAHHDALKIIDCFNDFHKFHPLQ